jgi:hypothetical protein
MSDGDRSSFLARWARRKQEAQAPAPPAPRAGADAEPPPLDEAALAEKIAALPKIDEIDAATDIRVFLESWVPDALKNAALRKLWASDPQIATFIEVADHQWDWTVPGGAPGSGPLEPGFDAEKFVAELFGDRDRASAAGRDSSPHEAAAASSDPVAAQHAEVREATPSAATGLVADADAAVSTSHVRIGGHRRDEDLCAPQQNLSPPAASEPARRRRHGGALPI